jgi:hypothetical protein
MAISPLPVPAPNLQTNTPNEFTQNVDALLGALPNFVSQANILQQNVNLKESSASNSSLIASNKVNEITLIAAQSASSAAQALTSALNAMNSYYLTQNLSIPILESQAQTNALLGLGIGGSLINENGELIMTYSDATVSNIQINSNGELVLTY